MSKPINQRNLMKLLFSMLFVFSFNANADICSEIQSAFIKTIQSGATKAVISQGADQIYSLVSTSGKGSHCKYLRYSFRVLKKPYNGDSVSPKEWDKAIQQLARGY